MRYAGNRFYPELWTKTENELQWFIQCNRDARFPSQSGVDMTPLAPAAREFWPLTRQLPAKKCLSTNSANKAEKIIPTFLRFSPPDSSSQR
jgi:hypothetical protein